MEEYRREIGARIVRLRESRSLGQEDLAHEAGVSVKTISRLENGRHEGRQGTIRRVAQALDVEPSAIIGEPPVPLGLGQDGSSVRADDGLSMLADLALAVETLAERLDQMDDKLDLILAAVGGLPVDEEGDAQDRLIEGTELGEKPPSGHTDCSGDHPDPPPGSRSG